MKYYGTFFVIGILFIFVITSSCKGKKAQIVGNDKDQYGCIGSAGYIWSSLLEECVRLWEAGFSLTNAQREKEKIWVIFNSDSSRVELILTNGTREILDKRTSDLGPVWNIEDDDTYNLMNNGGWKIERRGELLFK